MKRWLAKLEIAALMLSGDLLPETANPMDGYIKKQKATAVATP